MNVVVVILDSLRRDHVGAYGKKWIQTPNIDALAKESLRFTRAYPESIPEGQTIIAEIFKENGFRTMLVTDTMHQFKLSYNMQRGFEAFDFSRGQTTDNYAPIWTCPPDKVQQALLRGNVPAMRGQMHQYFSNVAGTKVPRRESGEDWFSPKVFCRAYEFLKMAGQSSDYHASTHDVAPTILGFLAIEPPEQMEGQDLSVLFGGGQPEVRPRFTLGYNDHSWARDVRYAIFAKNDHSEARLYDLQEDPGMNEDIASSRQDLLNSTWIEYVLKDAGGPCPGTDP